MPSRAFIVFNVVVFSGYKLEEIYVLMPSRAFIVFNTKRIATIAAILIMS